MKYARFEDLPVWQAAINLKLDLDDLTEHPLIRTRHNWIDQLDRASLSISNNVAEGFERGTTNELLMFLYIARGSAGEVRSMLHYMHRRLERQLRRRSRSGDANLNSQISNLNSEITRLIGRCESISRQLHGWANSLQNSDIKGVRHLTDQNKAAYHQQKQAEAFWEQNRRNAEAQMERRLREMRQNQGDDERPADELGTEP